MTSISGRTVAGAFAVAVLIGGAAPTVAAPLPVDAGAMSAAVTIAPTRIRWCPGSFPLIDGDNCPPVYYDPGGYSEPSVIDRAFVPVYGYRRVDGYYPRIDADYPRYRQPRRAYPVYK